MIRRLLYTLIVCFSTLYSMGQNDQWRLLKLADGLPSNKVNDVLMPNLGLIYAATDSGLFIQNQSAQFIYNTQNSNLPSNQINQLIMVNNELWLRSDSGLSQFNGRSFVNYNLTNGLLSNQINDLAIDTNQILWIASNAGVSRFDGNTFVHDSGKVAKAIVVDDSNRVFIARYTIIFNIPNASIDPVEMYDGQQWSIPTLGRFQDNYRAQFYKTQDGKILLLPSGGGNQFYGILNSAFDIERRPIQTGSAYSTTPNYINEVGDSRWLGFSVVSALYKSLTKDSSFTPMNLLPIGTRINGMSYYGNKMAIASDIGLVVGPVNINIPEYRSNLEVNQISANMNRNGSLFKNYENESNGFEYPKGSGKKLFRSVDFQFGIIRDNNVGTKEIYNIELYGLNYLSGPHHRSNRLVTDDYFIEIDKSTIDLHRQSYGQTGYQVPDVILNWPAKGDSILSDHPDLAPFFDQNQNGCYDPDMGDYPLIKGDRAIYWINHPYDKDLPLEFHWMLYAYNDPVDTFLNRTVFLDFRVINRDSNRIDYIKPALQLDADLGNFRDDFNGSDSSRQMIYFYNGDVFDESINSVKGYGANPPALGITILSDSLISANFYQTNVNSNPLLSVWNKLHGRNGNGGLFINPFSRGSTYFQFSGDPFANSGWTEFNLRPGAPTGNAPGDRKGTMGLRSFSLEGGSAHQIELAFVVAQGTVRNGLAEYVPLLKNRVDQVRSFVGRRFTPTSTYGQFFKCPLVTSLESNSNEKGILVYPNPNHGEFWINHDKVIQLIEIWNTEGKKIASVQSNQEKTLLSFEQLANGVYLLRVRDKSGNWFIRKLLVNK